MIGQRLSHFKITAKLGEGGMGEVYRAEDISLGREVAIKVLPEAFTADPERLSRFEREAHLLASLNHPHIAAIYEIGQEDPGDGAPALRFLAMELAEGEDLSKWLGRGATPIDETLTIALQIAQALEAAHERGVVHRDLKPANVMVSPKGQVKVLDFGLAKMGAEEESQPDLSLSPTLTAQMTQAGAILGTAAYMSPEQAKGKKVDRRADIWAFGVLLWEMLTGRRLFTGESASEVLASVLMSQPDMKALPSRTPARIRRLVERCLRRDPGSRLRDMGDARIVLEEALAGHEWTHESTQETRSTWPRLVPIVSLLAIGLLLGMGLIRMWGGIAAGDQSPRTELAIPLPSSFRIVFGGMPQLSPDGRTAIFSAVDIDPARADHLPRLYLRPLESSRLHEVEDSRGVAGYALSPDGKWLAFVANTPGTQNRKRLLKIPLDLSAPALELAQFSDDLTAERLLWPTMETLLTTRVDNKAIMPLPAQGGSPGSPVPTSASILLSAPLPGGQHVLATWPNFESGAYRQDSVVVDWHTGEVQTLVEDSSSPALAPTGRHLIFTREDKLLAVSFDPARLETSGATVSLREGLWAPGAFTGGVFGMSATGDLLYPAGGVQGGSRHLAFLTEDGVTHPWSSDRLFFNEVEVSPDGRWLATQVDNVTEGDALLQIRTSPLDQPRLRNIGALPGKDCRWPVWSPTSDRLAFTCIDTNSSALYIVPIDRSEPAAMVLEGAREAALVALGFYPAADKLIASQRSSLGARELISLALDGSETEPTVIPLEESSLLTRRLSPDARWLAYIADEAGRRELYVRRFEEGTILGPRYLAASNVEDLLWSKANQGEDYRILFLRNSKLWVVHMTADSVPRFSAPTELDINLFDLGILAIDSLPDGRFLTIRAPDTEIGAADLRFVLNWTRELETRFATSR